MVRSVSAMTFIPDDAGEAVRDILGQLAGFELLEHTAAILQCEAEFVKNGTVAALGAALPYPVVGGVTVTQGSNVGVGDYCLSVIVMTSDDAQFSAGRTEGMTDDLNGAVAKAYAEACAGFEGPPKLALIFPPVVFQYPGDAYIEAFPCHKETPIFGTEYVSEDVITHEGCVNVLGGECFEDEMTFLLVYGAVEPKFIVAVMSQEHVLPMKGTVTKASGTLVQEIDGMPALRFFEKMGLAKNGVPHEGFIYMPLIFRMRGEDGTVSAPFVRGTILLDENGLLCRGRAYEGSDVLVGTLDSAEVLNTTSAATDKINAMEGVDTAIIFSCIMRRIVSGANPQIESSKVRERLRKDLPFIMGSSGGEICPIAHMPGKVENKFHNYSFIACLL